MVQGVVDMLLEELFFAASCLVIVVYSFKMRATAYGKDGDKLRRPMNPQSVMRPPNQFGCEDARPPLILA